jgi:hypothetical protein
MLCSSSSVYALDSYSCALLRQDLCQNSRWLQINTLPTAFRPFYFRGVPLRGPFCKDIRSRKMLYVRHKSEKTSCTLVWLQAAASLKLSLTRFGSFILKLMRYTIYLVRRGQTVVIAHLVMRLQLLSIKRRFYRRNAFRSIKRAFR